MIHLSPRLAAVAERVPQGAAVIDVGTDHAMLPVWLVQSGRARKALASDVRPGPLRSAAALVEKTGTGRQVRLMLTDGLDGIGPADGDTVVLAGMGGETMISILSRAPWVREGICLILEPQSKKALLRRWLIENGFRIRSESLVEDAGRIYPVLCAAGGQAPACRPEELHLGLLAQVKDDPLFPAYLDVMCAQIIKAAPHDPEAAALLEAYESIRRQLHYGDSR